MTQSKTEAAQASLEAFLAQVTPDRRRQDAVTLDAVFREASGFCPRLWSGSIIGYGQYHDIYDSGRQGDFLATGFAPRKAKMVVYIMPGYTDFSDILADLGPHKLGKSCLYLGALSKIDLSVLSKLIRARLKDLGQRWPVTP